MAHSSLQKRFIWAAIPLLALLGTVVFYSQSLVDRTANQSIRAVAEIRSLERSINDIRSSLQTLEQQVYQRTVISYKDNSNTRQHILEQLDTLNNQVDNFIANATLHAEWQEFNKQGPESFAALTAQLKQTLHKIAEDIDRYNEIIADVRIRFPASRVIIDELFPLNIDFAREINMALDEFSHLPDTTANREIYNLLNELRYTWLHNISQFRLFVANRSGMFDTPEESMTSNLQNRNLYSKKVDELISQLEVKNDAGELPFQTSISIEAARNIFQEYEDLFSSIQHLYMSDGWRVDHVFLQKNIRPEFKHAARTIDGISNKIRFYATQKITETQNVASKITTMIWLTGSALVGLMILAYIIFERVIRQPISAIADAMNAEANGESFFPIMDTSIHETRLLVDAFRNMQEQVHSRETRLESILGSAAEGIVTMDEHGTIESFNQAAESLFGYSAAEIIGESIHKLFPLDDRAIPDTFIDALSQGKLQKTDSEVETTGLHRDGDHFPMSIKISEMVVAGQRLYTALVDDVSERITMISNLRHLAEHDSLTGLANRYSFLQELERVANRADRGLHENVALLYIDMDNFKYVNDTMGHLAGDKLLIEVSGMLKKRSREADLVARIGGDEFAVILYDVERSDVLKVADSFRGKLENHHFSFEGRVADVGCSIGVAMIEKGVTKDDMLARADLSCNAAKREGRNKVHVYSEVDKQNLDNISDDMGWVRRIKDALRNDRFMFVMQPIMHTETHEINRCEILLRMLDNEGKFIMPSGFIPAAERFSLMPEIDRWVVKHAMEYLISDKNSDINLSINLSAASFDNDEIINFITEKISQSGLDPTRMTFEITETVAMADLSLTASFLEKLRALGCRTALDDFGAGYASFAYLKDLPVDYVKIDGSFVRDIDTNELNKAIVKSMNDVAQAMGKLTVAEFVETEAGMRILELIGVDYLQGYHIGRPEIPAFEKRRITLGHSVASLL